MSQARAGIGKISKPGDRFTARRRILSGNPIAIGKHNRQVGEVLYAFNQAQAEFLFLFYTIFGLEKSELAREIWDSNKSDRRQRDLLKSYVAHTVKRKSICNAILWALDAMDKLSVRRNDAAHSDVRWHYDRLAVGLLPTAAQEERIQVQPLDTHWHSLRGDLAALANYVSDLNLTIGFAEPRPLTKRPRLKLVKPKPTGKSRKPSSKG